MVLDRNAQLVGLAGVPDFEVHLRYFILCTRIQAPQPSEELDKMPN